MPLKIPPWFLRFWLVALATITGCSPKRHVIGHGSDRLSIAGIPVRIWFFAEINPDSSCGAAAIAPRKVPLRLSMSGEVRKSFWYYTEPGIPPKKKKIYPIGPNGENFVLIDCDYNWRYLDLRAEEIFSELLKEWERNPDEERSWDWFRSVEKDISRRILETEVWKKVIFPALKECSSGGD